MCKLTIELSTEDRKILEHLEEELWCEETRFNIARMEQVIAEDFFEFGKSGWVYQKSDTLSIAPQPIEAVIPLPNLKVRLLTENLAQVTYNSVIKYDDVVEKTRRSSIWTRCSSSPQGWVLRFHQGTPFSEFLVIKS